MTDTVTAFSQRRTTYPDHGRGWQPMTSRESQSAQVGLVFLFLTEPREIKPGAFLVHTPWPHEQLRDGLKTVLPWLHELEALLNDD